MPSIDIIHQILSWYQKLNIILISFTKYCRSIFNYGIKNLIQILQAHKSYISD